MTRTRLQLHSVAPDLLPGDVGNETWNVARNVVFKNNETMRVAGDSPTLPGMPTPIEVMLYTEAYGAGYWICANKTGIWAHDGTTNHNITPTGWNPSAVATYTGCIINGLAVINAGNVPVWWNGLTASKMTPLPDWPSGRTCKAIRAHKNFLFAIGILETGGNECLWSDAAGPGQIPQYWTPTNENLAGSVNLAPLFETCLDALSLRDELLIYKKGSIWAASLCGGNAVFAFRVVFSETGLAATNAVCASFDDRHLFVASMGDVVVTDGVNIQSVLEGRAQRVFQDDYSSAINPRVLAASLDRQKLGMVIYPSASNAVPVQALLYDFTSGDISFRDMPPSLCAASGALLKDVGNVNTWDGDNAVWNSDGTAWNEQVSGKTNDDVFVGGSSGAYCISDQTVSAFWAGEVQAVLQKVAFQFGDGATRFLVKQAWPNVTGTAGESLQFRFYGQEIMGGPLDVSEPLDFIIGQAQPLHLFMQGRYLGFEVVSQGGDPWRFGSMDLVLSEIGQW